MFALIGIVLLLSGAVFVMFNRRIARAVGHSRRAQTEGLERSTARQNILFIGVVFIVGGLLFVFLY